jgi:hypothetical protein
MIDLELQQPHFFYHGLWLVMQCDIGLSSRCSFHTNSSSHMMRGEWPARWEPQEEGVMSIAARFPSVKKPRFIVLGEERQATEGDAC